jgi:hypothetical protein
MLSFPSGLWRDGESGFWSSHGQPGSNALYLEGKASNVFRDRGAQSLRTCPGEVHLLSHLFFDSSFLGPLFQSL